MCSQDQESGAGNDSLDELPPEGDGPGAVHASNDKKRIPKKDSTDSQLVPNSPIKQKAPTAKARLASIAEKDDWLLGFDAPNGAPGHSNE